MSAIKRGQERNKVSSLNQCIQCKRKTNRSNHVQLKRHDFRFRLKCLPIIEVKFYIAYSPELKK